MFFEKILRILPRNKLISLRNLIDSEISKISSRENNVRNFWNKGSSLNMRSRLTPPARPSEKTLGIYRKFLEAKAPKKLLILGSTPELRDLAFKLKTENYVVADFNPEMIINNLKLCRGAEVQSEIWIKSDWLSLPVPENYFDAILGDLVLGQFKYENQFKLLDRIAGHLSKDGIFITRTHISDPKLANIEATEIIRITLENPTADNRMQKLIMLSWRLRDKFRDERAKTTDPQKILHALNNYTAKNDMEKELVESLKKSAERRTRNNLFYINQSAEETEALFKKFFSSVKKEAPFEDEDGIFFPVYCLKK